MQPEQPKQELTAEQKDFVKRAKLADEELNKIQKKYRLKLTTNPKIEYRENGIFPTSSTVWINETPTKKIKK